MARARLIMSFLLAAFIPCPFAASAAEVRWRHLSSKSGELPAPGKSTQQTGALVADLDKDGLNDFVLSFRKEGPALVWYRRGKEGWARHIIEPAFLTVEAGGAAHDIDGDGDLDLVFGGDWQSNQLWWWENPGPAAIQGPWARHIIKSDGARQHHDQCFADFKGTGKPQLAFWNQGAKKLFVADIPANVRSAGPWPVSEVFSGSAGENPGKYAEGLSASDIDGDGRPDLLAGNHWFKHTASGWRGTRIGAVGGLIFAGRLIENSRAPQVVIAAGDGVGPVCWHECRGDPGNPDAWVAHKLVERDAIHAHSLQLADIDADGHLDIFVAEMAQWTEGRAQPDHPDATAWIFYGDGKGNFRQTIFARGMGFHEARIADLDGDGRLDLLSKPYTWQTPRVDVWLQVAPAANGSP